MLDKNGKEICLGDCFITTNLITGYDSASQSAITAHIEANSIITCIGYRPADEDCGNREEVIFLHPTKGLIWLGRRDVHSFERLSK